MPTSALFLSLARRGYANIRQAIPLARQLKEPPPENSFVEEASVTGATWICRHQLGNTPHSSIEETPPRTPSKNSFVEEASLAGAIWICRYQHSGSYSSTAK